VAGVTDKGHHRERAISCLSLAGQLAVREAKGMRENTSDARNRLLEEAVDELLLAAEAKMPK
jgi:hypothetical protein